MRERSYASEPGSRIALKLDDEKEKKVSHELGLTTDDEDEDDDTIECDVGIRTSTLSEPLDFGRRSQTLLEVVSLFNWRTPSHFTLFAHESRLTLSARQAACCRPAVGRALTSIYSKNKRDLLYICVMYKLGFHFVINGVNVFAPLTC